MLSLDNFATLVGEPFSLGDESGEIQPAVLVEASALPGPAFNGRAPFRLMFEGPAEPVMAQCTFKVEHSALGRLDIFLVPVGRSAAGVRYEAVFS